LSCGAREGTFYRKDRKESPLRKPFHRGVRREYPLRTLRKPFLAAWRGLRELEDDSAFIVLLARGVKVELDDGDLATMSGR